MILAMWVLTATASRAVQIQFCPILTEAEIRDILEAAVRPANRIRLGSALSVLSRKAGLTNADFEALEQSRDKTPAAPMSFE